MIASRRVTVLLALLLVITLVSFGIAILGVRHGQAANSSDITHLIQRVTALEQRP